MSTYTRPRYAQLKHRHGVVIDWETSGSDWDGKSHLTYQGISVGVVVFDLYTFMEVDSLYLEIRFDDSRYKWSDAAERIHGLTRDRLALGLSQDEAAVELVSFILKHFSPDEAITVLGHNRQFDIDFTEQLLSPRGIMFTLQSTCLDTSGLGFTLLGLHKSDDLFDFLGLPKRQDHNALEDCRYELAAVRRLKQIFNDGLGVSKTGVPDEMIEKLIHLKQYAG